MTLPDLLAAATSHPNPWTKGPSERELRDLAPEMAALLIEARDWLDAPGAPWPVKDLLARIDGLTGRSDGSQDVPPVVTSNPAGDPTVRDLERDEAAS